MQHQNLNLNFGDIADICGVVALLVALHLAVPLIVLFAGIAIGFGSRRKIEKWIGGG